MTPRVGPRAPFPLPFPFPFPFPFPCLCPFPLPFPLPFPFPFPFPLPFPFPFPFPLPCPLPCPSPLPPPTRPPPPNRPLPPNPPPTPGPRPARTSGPRATTEPSRGSRASRRSLLHTGRGLVLVGQDALCYPSGHGRGPRVGTGDQPPQGLASSTLHPPGRLSRGLRLHVLGGRVRRRGPQSRPRPLLRSEPPLRREHPVQRGRDRRGGPGDRHHRRRHRRRAGREPVHPPHHRALRERAHQLLRDGVLRDHGAAVAVGHADLRLRRDDRDRLRPPRGDHRLDDHAGGLPLDLCCRTSGSSSSS